MNLLFNSKFHESKNLDKFIRNIYDTFDLNEKKRRKAEFGGFLMVMTVIE